MALIAEVNLALEPNRRAGKPPDAVTVSFSDREAELMVDVRVTVTAVGWFINDPAVPGGDLGAIFLGADGRETADMGDARQPRLTSSAGVPSSSRSLSLVLGEGAGEGGVRTRKSSCSWWTLSSFRRAARRRRSHGREARRDRGSGQRNEAHNRFRLFFATGQPPLVEITG